MGLRRGQRKAQGVCASFARNAIGSPYHPNLAKSLRRSVFCLQAQKQVPTLLSLALDLAPRGIDHLGQIQQTSLNICT